MTHPNPATAKVNRENEAAALERTSKIVSLLSRRLSVREIAAEVGCSTTTVYALYAREKERIRTLIASELRHQLDVALDELDVIARDAHLKRIEAKTMGEKAKAMNVLLQVIDKRAKLLGLYAPEQHQHLHGHVDPGVDIPLEVLEAMSSEERAALLDEHRAAVRALPAASSAADEEDDDDESTSDDDGLPPEVVIEDPGPHSVAPRPRDDADDGGEGGDGSGSPA